MRWYRDLTASQRKVLAGLALGLLVVLGLLGWAVWSGWRAALPPSPLATPAMPPSLAKSSPLRTPLTPPAKYTLTPTATATSTPRPTPTPTPTPFPSFDVAEAGLIAAEVADARGIPSRWGTPLTLVDELEMSVALYRHYRDFPPLPLAARPIFETLGLWFWDELRIDAVAHAEQGAAIYVPENEELYLRRDWQAPLEILQIQLAYAYARALSEQYGNLLALQEQAPSLDRWLALKSMGDGDALLSVWLYAAATPESARAATLAELVAAASQVHWQADDPLLEELAHLSLTVGGDFAAALHATGGLEALDAALTLPPRSTEQMLHPERYLSGDEPIIITPLALDLARGWQPLAPETVGEALMGLVILEWSNARFTPEAVTGWGGDLLQIWEDEAGQRVALWQLTWDTSADAARVYAMLREILPGPLLYERVVDTTAPAAFPQGRWWAGREGAVFLRRQGKRLWLVWGDDIPTVIDAGSVLATPSPAETE